MNPIPSSSSEDNMSFWMFLSSTNSSIALTSRAKQSIIFLGIFSLTQSIVFAIIIGWYIQLHLDYTAISLTVSSFCFFIFLLINKIAYQFSGKSRLVSLSLYFGIYLLVSVVVLPHGFLFQYYAHELGEGTPAELFAAYSELLQNLKPHEVKAMIQFKWNLTVLGMLLPILNIGINFLASKQIGNDMEQQREAMLMDLQQKIIKRQKEYSQLMDSNSENPFSISDDELEMKKETLLSEIQHLKISLQQFQ
jgi:hypothetical protein